MSSSDIRRQILSDILDSEMSYIHCLSYLIEDLHPRLRRVNLKLRIFDDLVELLGFHTIFQQMLDIATKNWDNDQTIAYAFIAAFSSATVIEKYASFINKFQLELKTIDLEMKRNERVRQVFEQCKPRNPNQLPYYGLIIKPVQRFPQYALFLEDLIKHTPEDHSDYAKLKLAKRQIERITIALNQKPPSTISNVYNMALDQFPSIRSVGRLLTRRLARFLPTKKILARDTETTYL